MSDQPHPSVTLRNVFFFVCALSAVAWLALPSEWAIPLGSALSAVSLVLGYQWLSQPGPARVEAPDVLAQHVDGYFERDGLCFAPRLSVTDGLCWFELFLQNRYAKPCRGMIYFVPMEGMSPSGAHEVAPLIADIECAGGEVGVVRFPYPIASRRQGTIMVYDVMAAIAYPAGAGELLRTPHGVPVGEPTSDPAEILKTAGLLALGKLRISKGASCELRLPENVRESAPQDAATTMDVLWQYQTGP